MPKNHILPPQPPLFTLFMTIFGTDYTEKHGLSIINYQLSINLIPVPKVLVALGQLMMHQRGKDLLQL